MREFKGRFPKTIYWVIVVTDHAIGLDMYKNPKHARTAQKRLQLGMPVYKNIEIKVVKKHESI